MAATKKTAVNKATISALDQPERFRLGEMGHMGLRVFQGVSQDELKRELNFPESIMTFKEMSYHSSVNAALTLFENIISKATWNFKPLVDATEEEKKQCKIIDSMMKDMEQPWSEFIRDILSANVFGFSVHEKVFRRRLHASGSLYDDGLIGWRKMPIRAQESIEKFIYSEDGNEIIGVKQNFSKISDPYGRFSNRLTTSVVLPRSKFLHFRTGKHRGDPFGKSPLRDAYLAWRFLVALEELEATGVAKDLNGLPVLTLPAQYLSADATPDQMQIRMYYENVMRNIQVNAQGAVILPQVIDPESKIPMFKLELLSVDGKKNFDISKIKDYYKNLIFTSLFADVLQMGQSSTGSFALGSSKNSLSGAYAERLITNIAEVINNDLIKQTYELNGWDVSRMGFLDYDNLEQADLETLSKYIQRVASVGLLEADRSVLNAVRLGLGVDPRPEDEEPRQEYLSQETSRAGDGMATAGEGTSKSPSGSDTTSNNLENS